VRAAEAEKETIYMGCAVKKFRMQEEGKTKKGQKGNCSNTQTSKDRK
jgi:hypothetical protein